MPNTDVSADLHDRIDDLLSQGDPAAAELMLDHYGPRLRDRLRRFRGGGLNDHDIADVVAESIEYVWKRRAEFDPNEGSAYKLVFWKAKRLKYDKIKQNARWLLNSSREDGTAFGSLLCTRESPADQASKRELVAKVMRMLCELTALQRDAFLASVHHSDPGYAKVVAQRHGTTTGTVRGAALAAREKIKKAMLPFGDDITWGAA